MLDKVVALYHLVVMRMSYTCIHEGVHHHVVNLAYRYMNTQYTCIYSIIHWYFFPTMAYVVSVLLSHLLLCIAICAYGLCQIFGVGNLLELNRTRDEIAQERTHTQRHVNNAWNEMDILTPYFTLYCSFATWFLQTIWDNFSPTTDQPCKLITTLFLLVLHFYNYKQSNASSSTLPLCE